MMSSDKIMSDTAIGAAIKRRRLELAITQEELASRLDVSYQQIQRYERGTNKLNVEKIQLLADALSVSVGYFLDTPPRKAKMFQIPIPCPKEQELLVLFRKIRDDHLKEIVVNLSRLAAQDEEQEI